MRRFALALCVFSTSLAIAAPCVTATKPCTEWVALGGSAHSLIYRTHSLDVKNESITRAFILVHGAGRDADNYFRSAVAAAFLAGALENTAVIAPRFASNGGGAGGGAGGGGCNDTLAADEVNWPCGGESWRAGGVSSTHKDLTSFDFADAILRKLAGKTAFPNLRTIVIGGHSAGGQFVTRYVMANQVHEKLGVPVTYVVSNPSSYAYLDDTRPGDSAYSVSARAPGYVPAPAASEGGSFRSFRDGRGCTNFDQWPYGLKNRGGYTAKIPDEQLKKQAASRPVIYLLGELDILPLGGFDGSCGAMAQGPTRLARGEAYGKYINEKFGAQHQVKIVPLCGHNGRCMFTSEVALPLVFPDSK